MFELGLNSGGSVMIGLLQQMREFAEKDQWRAKFSGTGIQLQCVNPNHAIVTVINFEISNLPDRPPSRKKEDDEDEDEDEDGHEEGHGEDQTYEFDKQHVVALRVRHSSPPVSSGPNSLFCTGTLIKSLSLECLFKTVAWNSFSGSAPGDSMAIKTSGSEDQVSFAFPHVLGVACEMKLVDCAEGPSPLERMPLATEEDPSATLSKTALLTVLLELLEVGETVWIGVGGDYGFEKISFRTQIGSGNVSLKFPAVRWRTHEPEEYTSAMVASAIEALKDLPESSEEVTFTIRRNGTLLVEYTVWGGKSWEATVRQFIMPKRLEGEENFEHV